MASSASGAPRARGIFARKPHDQIEAEAGREDGLKRAVGVLDLTALGIGAIIGTGIFVIIGEAIGLGGPSIILSFALAGVTCLFSALVLRARVDDPGLRQRLHLRLRDARRAAGLDHRMGPDPRVRRVGRRCRRRLGRLPEEPAGLRPGPEPARLDRGPAGEAGKVNLPAVVLVLGVAALLMYGVRESARFNTGMVFAKLAVLVFFIVVGFSFIDGDNFSPWSPEGTGGTIDAAALIFFAYIGFDAISTSGEEAENPQRDLPIAIIGSLLIATLLYILVAVVAVGLAPSDELAGSEAPLSDAIKIGAGYDWAGDILSLGALIAITSVVLTILYGQTRIMFSMSRDGLVPRWLAHLSPRRTPARITAIFAALIAALAAFVPLSEIAKLVNIGTLFAFLIVNVAVIVLRRTQPDLERAFRVPLVPFFPIIGAALCIYPMSRLDGVTWVRFGLWLLVGLVIYGAYGYRHSRLQRGEGADTNRPLSA